jgi:hypothetical protein
MPHRTTRTERKQAERDRARRGQDPDDVLAQDELARERLASAGRRKTSGAGAGKAPPRP